MGLSTPHLEHRLNTENDRYTWTKNLTGFLLQLIFSCSVGERNDKHPDCLHYILSTPTADAVE